MNFNIDIKVHNEFLYEVLDANGNPTGKKGECTNDILDAYFSRLSTLGNSTTFSHIHVGTGASATSLSMTALENKLTAVSMGGSSESTAVIAADGLTATAKKTYTTTFAVGAVVGTITEFGAGYSSTTVATRALLKDANGNPTTLTILASEQLILTYNFYITVPTTLPDYVVNLNTDGVLTPVTLTTMLAAPAGESTYADTGSVSASLQSGDTAFGAVGVNPGSPIANITLAGVSGSSGVRRYSVTIAASSANHASGIGSIRFSGFKVKFTPAIMKTSDMTFTISTQMNYSRG